MKIIKALSLSAAALVAVMVGGASVNAAETTDSTLEKSSIAEFKVKPGELTLDEVPNMHFEPTTVKDIATTGATLAYKDSTLTQKIDSEGNASVPATSDGNSKGFIQVSDFRGTKAGWKLSVALGDFTNGKDTLTGTTLSLVTGKQISVLGDDGSYLVYDATKAPNKGVAVNRFNVDSNSKLTIPQNENVKAGTYQADLTWTLANTATTTAAQ